MIALRLATALAVAAAAEPLPAALSDAIAARTQAEALAALERAEAADLRRLPFDDVEALVRRGWWRAAQAVVTRSHTVRMDFTAPVRRATQDIKREADTLLKWLDPKFANPMATPMAMRWAQNTTAVMLACRFAPRWDAPGAQLAVYSTERGRGHVDMRKTLEVITRLLRVNLTDSRLDAEIVADSGSMRKRYILSADLLDEVVPERSVWNIEFVRAAGSMQMSTGAQIPELHILLRKRWPGTRPWPRLRLTGADAAVGAAMAWWAEAPGATETDIAALRGATPLGQTPLTCAAAGRIHCATQDECVQACGACTGVGQLHSSGQRCVPPPRRTEGALEAAMFIDEDVAHGVVGGVVQWQGDPGALADEFALYWSDAVGEAPLEGTPAIAKVPARFADPVPSYAIPHGTAPPPGAARILIVATNEAGATPLAAATLTDAVRPPPPVAVRFEDTDPLRGWAGGVVEIDPAEDETHVEAYELRWGAVGDEARTHELEELSATAPLATLQPRGGSRLSQALPRAGAQAPSGVAWLLAFAVGPGGVRSAPAAAKWIDAAPPNVLASRIDVTADADPRAGHASVDLTVWPGSCAKWEREYRAKNQEPGQCELGSTYRVYWLREGSRVGKPLVEAATSSKSTVRIEALMPSGASGFTALAANRYGEMPHGPLASFADDRSQRLETWRPTRAAGACDDGRLVVWRPLGGGGEEPVAIDAPGMRIHGVSVVALGAFGERMLVGQDDGGVALLVSGAAGAWTLQRAMPGIGAVTALAFDDAALRALRGARGGVIDVLDLGSGAATAQLQGHTGDVTSMDADWSTGRAATASRDGSVRFWDLRSHASIRVLTVDAFGVDRVVVDWSSGRLLTASADETLKLFGPAGASEGGAAQAVLEGHAEPVRQLLADFDRQRAVSIASDGIVKVWNLETRECLHTFGGATYARPMAAVTRWGTLQAMLVLEDGRVSSVELEDHQPHGAPSAGGCTMRAAALA